jgi:hypothetical protein
MIWIECMKKAENQYKTLVCKLEVKTTFETPRHSLEINIQIYLSVGWYEQYGDSINLAHDRIQKWALYKRSNKELNSIHFIYLFISDLFNDVFNSSD